MGWITLSSGTVKTKKAHQCNGCSKIYPPGSKMQKVACVDSGDFSSTYWCLICEEFMSDKWSDLDGEGLGFGDIWNYPEYGQFRFERENKITAPNNERSVATGASSEKEKPATKE